MVSTQRKGPGFYTILKSSILIFAVFIPFIFSKGAVAAISASRNDCQELQEPHDTTFTDPRDPLKIFKAPKDFENFNYGGLYAKTLRVDSVETSCLVRPTVPLCVQDIPRSETDVRNWVIHTMLNLWNAQVSLTQQTASSEQMSAYTYKLQYDTDGKAYWRFHMNHNAFIRTDGKTLIITLPATNTNTSKEMTVLSGKYADHVKKADVQITIERTQSGYKIKASTVSFFELPDTRTGKILYGAFQGVGHNHIITKMRDIRTRFTLGLVKWLTCQRPEPISISE